MKRIVRKLLSPRYTQRCTTRRILTWKLRKWNGKQKIWRKKNIILFVLWKCVNVRNLGLDMHLNNGFCSYYRTGRIRITVLMNVRLENVLMKPTFQWVNSLDFNLRVAFILPFDGNWSITYGNKQIWLKIDIKMSLLSHAVNFSTWSFGL